MTDSNDPRADGAWGHAYTLLPDQTQFHQLGQKRFWITLLAREWQVRHEHLPTDADPLAWPMTLENGLPPADPELQRFVRPANDDGTLCYLPAMAPLPTVIRPYQPLVIPAGERCVLYVGTLLWLQLCVGRSRLMLAEWPLAQPSRTWLGANTMTGDLCFSSATYGRLALEAVPKRPWRAVTPVTIINRRDEALLLERFSLPTPLLSIHRNEHGQLWTPGVSIECETDMSSASLRVDASLIPEAGLCQMLAPAREKLGRRRLVRTFDHIFG